MISARAAAMEACSAALTIRCSGDRICEGPTAITRRRAPSTARRSSTAAETEASDMLRKALCSLSPLLASLLRANARNSFRRR